MSNLIIGSVGRDDVTDILKDVEVELTVQGVSQVTFTMPDPELYYTQRGYFQVGLPVQFMEMDLEMASVEIGSKDTKADVTVECRTAPMQKMKRDRKPVVSGPVSPTEFVQAHTDVYGMKMFGQNTFGTSSDSGATGHQAPILQVVSATSDESVWDVIKRLAGEYQFWTFESMGTLFFTSQVYLLGKFSIGDGITLHYPADPSKSEFQLKEIPTCRASDDDVNGATFTAKILQPDGSRLRPGMTVTLHGVPGFEMDYLITSVKWTDGTNDPVTIEAATPDYPKLKDRAGNLLNAAGDVVDEQGNLLGIAPKLD